MNKQFNTFIKLYIWVTVICLLIRCLISKDSVIDLLNEHNFAKLCYNLICFIGEATFFSTILMSLFNKYFWKWRWIRIFVNTPPVLASIYIGYIKSDWNKKEKENVKLEIKQTFLSISLKLFTDESMSYSILSLFEIDSDPQKIYYFYHNIPEGHRFDSSIPHDGTAELTLMNDGVLSGNYYTERKTCGSMKFKPNHIPVSNSQ